MRYKLAEHGIGGRNESWYYVEFDEGTGEAFLIHEWDNLSSSLSTNSGEKRVPMAESQGSVYYDDAVRILDEKHAGWDKPRS